MIDMSALANPSPITWEEHVIGDMDIASGAVNVSQRYWDCKIAGQLVASLEPRPAYCDRGHWYVKCELPDLDDADRFPRYYMDFNRAMGETEDFLKWRLWKIRGSNE